MFALPLLGLLTTQGVAPTIKIDPLLIVKADEVWSVVGRRDNPVWPGWDARRTPLLIYFPGKQDLLINHPKPPEDFRRYEGPIRSRAGAIFIRDGKTLFDLDGQNTATDVNGIQTLVVADTLSTRRQWAEGLAPALVAEPARADEIVGGNLSPNPYGSMLIFAHEAFHVYQHSRAIGKAPHEMDLASYPSLSVVNNVGFALEADCLAAALRAKDDVTMRKEALRWLAVRLDRRATLSPTVRDYEDAVEFEEGLAKYVEYRTLQVLEGWKPSREMWLVQGFHGYDGLNRERDLMVSAMQGFLTGKTGVNDDPYGASPVRFRLYFSGMAIGALLDLFGVKWHDRIFADRISLTSLATEAIHASPTEIASALTEIHGKANYASLVQEKTELAMNGEDAIAKAVAEFNVAPGELVIDYSGLKEPTPSFGYTPFGILRVDDDRNLFRLVPIRGEVGGAKFSENGRRAVLYDRKAKTIRLQLTAAPTAAQAGDFRDSSLSLPGVSLEKVRGKLTVEGRRALLKLSD